MNKSRWYVLRHSVMRKKSPFYDFYYSIAIEDIFKFWQVLKCDFRFSPQVIIMSDGKAGSESFVFPKVHTRSFLLLEEAFYLET